MVLGQFQTKIATYSSRLQLKYLGHDFRADVKHISVWILKGCYSYSTVRRGCLPGFVCFEEGELGHLATYRITFSFSLLYMCLMNSCSKNQGISVHMLSEVHSTGILRKFELIGALTLVHPLREILMSLKEWLSRARHLLTDLLLFLEFQQLFLFVPLPSIDVL